MLLQEKDIKLKKNIADWTKENDNKVVSKSLKYGLVFFAFFFWILGALFAAVGGWHISQSMGFREVTSFSYGAFAIFAGVGCLVFVISSFGVLGALRENICFLRTYKLFLLTIFVITLIAGMVGFAFWPEVKKFIDKNIRRGIQHYTDNEALRNMIDQMQWYVGCCGSLTVHDWDSNNYYRCKIVGSYRSCGVPWSCCLPKHFRNYQCGYKIRKKRTKINLENEIYTIGCMDKIFEKMRKNMYMIGGVSVAGLVVLIAGILMSHRLGKQIRKVISLYNVASEEYGWQGTRTQVAIAPSNASDGVALLDTYY